MTAKPDPRPPSERTDATGSWHANPLPRGAAGAGYPSADPPTVRSGPPAQPAGSSSTRRVELIPGPAPRVVGAPLPLPLPHPGERIDMFELEESIGVGGMGAVFRAMDTRLDRHVALKILPPEQAHDPEVVQRFYQEGRAAARLDHENIARVFTIGNDGRYHYIAFEYIEGTTVRQRVEKNGPSPVGEAINYTLQIADALVHAAERGVVHRDIKPSNIIVTPHGRAKLVDMGLARRFERGGDDGLTQSGMTLGTFDYISPEQARDPRDVDVRSDLYSLGCTLFHMLTGRPPFPEGTVLQKLIQHQEEPPPDVRALNPAVTADLASILVKLMAKDRDRRYQAPEQLVRDLLTVAGALGLRSVSPEGLVWLSSDGPPAWQRHLVWGVPAMVFALIVSALGWWGQDPGAISQAPPDFVPKPFNPVSSAPPPAKADRPGGPARGDASTAPADPAGAVDDLIAGEAPPPAPGEVTVESTDDLLAALAGARPRSVVLLTDDGPYDLGVDRNGRPSPRRLDGRDLTVKAAPGVHPVLRLARGVSIGAKPRGALLEFAGGTVTLDGLEFLLEPGDRAEPPSAVAADDTELTVSRCVFRVAGVPPGPAQADARPRPSAIRVRSSPTPRGGDRPAPLSVDRCHFDAGQVAVRAAGPADVRLRDCTLAASEPAFWFDNGRAAAAVASDLRLRHVSVLAGEGPVFRFDGTDARVWADDSVVAAAGEGEATLVATDRPEALVWRGRGNLYARVGTFLLPTDGVLGREAVRDPARWRETAEGVRETGSAFETQSVWADADPSQVLAQEPQHPAHAFRLAAGHPGGADVGSRQDPFGAPVPTTLVASNTRPSPESRPSPAPAPATAPAAPPDRRPAATAPARPEPLPMPPPPTSGGGEPAAPDPAPSRVNDLPPMAVMPPTGGGATGREKDRDKDKSPEPAAAQEPDAPVAAAEKPPAGAEPVRAERAVIHTRDQLLNALAEPGAQDRPLRVAAGADWEVPSSAVRATGSWRIQAEPGATRPRLRFLPGAGENKGANAWNALIELRSGSLQLDGFDVILPRENAPRLGRWAAFAVWPGTDLSLTNCTVTVEGDQVASAVVSVEPGDNPADDGMNGADMSASTVRFNDSLVRGGGDVVNVAPGRRLVLEMDNAVAAAGGALAHAHGVARGQSAERISLTLRQVTARVGGGLVHLEAAAGEPELPVAEVNARYSVLSTAPEDAPLVCVDGQDAPETTRDKIVWEGQGVGYDQITTYRRDQSSQLGAVPSNYNRADWNRAVGAREQLPVHGDLKFRRDWAPDRPAWTFDREDARLSKDTPARASGSDLDRIPDPPVGES